MWNSEMQHPNRVQDSMISTEMKSQPVRIVQSHLQFIVYRAVRYSVSNVDFYF